MHNLTSHVVHFSTTNLSDQWEGTSIADAELDGHPAESLVVIDFITIAVANGSSRGALSWNILSATENYKITGGCVTLEAGDSDTLHLVYPKGLPCRTRSGATDTPPPQTALSFNSTNTFTDELVTVDVWIGFHYERPSFRR